jgi:[ribosomal protein S18]-alanine N-acetyltransferase
MITQLTLNQLNQVIFLEQQLHLTSCVNFPQAMTHVFEIDNQVLGFITWIIHDNEVELLNIGVDPTFHGQGVGTRLMKEWFELLKDSNPKRIYVEVRKSNERAIKLYKRFKFELNRTRYDYYENPIEDALEMRFDYE